MSAAVARMKRRLDDYPDSQIQKRVRCGGSSHVEHFQHRESVDSPSCSFSPPHQDAGAPGASPQPDACGADFSREASELLKAFPRLSLATIQAILEINKNDVVAACQMVHGLVEAVNGRCSTLDGRAADGTLGNSRLKRRFSASETSSNSSASPENDVPDEQTREWTGRIVSSVETSQSSEEAIKRISRIVKDLRTATAHDAVQTAEAQNKELLNEIKNLREHQQVCGRAITSQHEKMQALMSTMANKETKEKELIDSLQSTHEENRRLKEMNLELQFFLASANQAPSELPFVSRQPDVF